MQQQQAATCCGRESYKLLHAGAQENGVNCASLYVEVLLASMLALPSPKHKQMFYACVVVDLCKLLPSVPLALETALNILFSSLPRLDPELAVPSCG